MGCGPNYQQGGAFISSPLIAPPSSTWVPLPCERRTESWPSLTVAIEMAPWHWRIERSVDDIHYAWTLIFGPLTIELWTDRRRPQ
jgi:hypothetical protein